LDVRSPLDFIYLAEVYDIVPQIQINNVRVRVITICNGIFGDDEFESKIEEGG
jgi:hypothetical protein